MRRPTVAAVLAGAALVGVAGTALAAGGGPDAGLDRQRQQEAHSLRYFGVVSGLPHSSTQDVDRAAATADPTRLVSLARGLHARVVTAGQAAPNLDMMALWPAEDPQWIVACNEQGTGDPGVQRIDLRTGEATTVVTGTTSCDPLHVTPWGTVVFGEEAGTSGAVYELTDPTRVTGVHLDRATGRFSGGTGADLVVRRDALGFLSYEGLGILPSGVAYYGDELGPSSGGVGGSYYKFVPDRPWDGRTPVASLADSPLASGTVYGLRVGQGANHGQGVSYGDGSWIEVQGGRSLRDQAAATTLTGYYRPEDISLDERALASGRVRFCGNDTGREQAHYYGETICVTDGSTADALAGTTVPRVQLLVAGSPALNMPDNIAYQPGRGTWIVHEDGETDVEGPHGDDLWSCLDDGDDADLLGDGCIRIASVNDLGAEFTGGFFDRGGTHFYVSVQHNLTGRGVVLDVTGWR